MKTKTYRAMLNTSQPDDQETRWPQVLCLSGVLKSWLEFCEDAQERRYGQVCDKDNCHGSARCYSAFLSFVY